MRSAWRKAEPPATRASDAERDDAVIRLRESCGEGRLTLDEFTDRMGAAYEAMTHADLDVLTRDLPARPPSPVPDARRTIIGVLGTGNQRGRWQVAKRTTLVACLGHCDVDLGSAVITDSEVTLRAFAMLGSVRVTVPSGVNVIVDGSSILGSTDVRLDRSGPPPPPGAPTIRIRAYTLLGSAEVIGRRPKLLDRLRETRERWRSGAR
jgi:Domain of unknown function (DUF1707)/Cell wall-active antibiotics response 4TMS YvqF